MIAVDSWNWQAKSALFWYGCNLICFAWAFFRLPETGGFSFAELDILFANKVPTRKFKEVKIIG
jgi:MFS transporter, SP family, general alpha glucoside:H+ symporter